MPTAWVKKIIFERIAKQMRDSQIDFTHAHKVKKSALLDYLFMMSLCKIHELVQCQVFGDQAIPTHGLMSVCLKSKFWV